MLAMLEAIVYITDEPLSAKQIADAVQKPLDYVKGCWTNSSTSTTNRITA